METGEGRVLLLELALAFCYALGLGAVCLADPERALDYLGTTATFFVFGRMAGMMLGYAREMGHAAAVPMAMLIETVRALLLYPLFVFSLRRLVIFPRVEDLFLDIRRRAETHREWIHRYGVLGLFGFVWFPFWMTGPAVGSDLGYLMSPRASINLPVVLAGTYVAIACWAALLRELHAYVDRYERYASPALAASFILGVLAALAPARRRGSGQ